MPKRPAFPEVDQRTIDTAISVALAALTDASTPSLLAEFYDPASNYAGATFAQLEPNERDSVEAADLLAVTTLAIDFPTAALRRILQEASNRSTLAEKLRALPNKRLEETDPSDFARMGEFYDALKPLLSSPETKYPNPWVTTSKLVARKRPDLFPVRDRVVCGHLGILHLNDYAKDWFVFRKIMRDTDVVKELGQLPDRVKAVAGTAGLVMDNEPLRLLDAALWRQGKRAADSKV